VLQSETLLKVNRSNDDNGFYNEKEKKIVEWKNGVRKNGRTVEVKDTIFLKILLLNA